MSTLPVVLLTDHAWADTSVESGILQSAGFELVTGPQKPAAAEVIARLSEQHQPMAIMTTWAPVSAEAIAASRNLRIVARLGVGLDNIAVEVATARGVWVSNVPDYCVEEVSDHAVGMLLAWARGLTQLDLAVKHGHWEPAQAQLRRVRDLTCGIVGFGRIGRRTAEKLSGFQLRVLVHARTETDLPEGIERCTLEALLTRSDAVILHVPLTSSTHHLLDASRLALMKRGACLINVSRGAVVDTQALIEALDQRRLSAAALDVLEGEPNVPFGLLRPEVILSPHVAFSSDASVRELRRRASEEVVRVLKGQSPCNPCNQPSAR